MRSPMLLTDFGKSIIAPEHTLRGSMKALYVCCALLGLAMVRWAFRRQSPSEVDHVSHLRSCGLL